MARSRGYGGHPPVTRLLLVPLAAVLCVSCASGQAKANRAMAKLRPDMTKREVSDTLGYPYHVTSSSFGVQTWKYYYSDDGKMWHGFPDPDAQKRARRDEELGLAEAPPRIDCWLTLEFKDGRLQGWETH